MAHYYVRQRQAVFVLAKQSGVLSLVAVTDMKVRVDIHSEGLPVPYVIKYKKNWWSRWRYIKNYDGSVRIFTEREWQSLVLILTQI